MLAKNMIDTHCHIDFPKFDADRQAVLASSLRAGVQKIVVPGVSASQWPKIQALIEQTPSLYFAVGVHPWWVNQSVISKLESLESEIATFLSHKKCVAVGECGLDKLCDVPFEWQVDVLNYHIELAKRFCKPIILHSVKAHNATLVHLKNGALTHGGVVHAFSGSTQEADQYWQQGFYLGIGGTITYPRANKTRKAVAAMPLDALLLETDAPDMPMNGRQGLRNSPEYLPEVVAVIAELKNISPSEVIAATTANAQKLFNFNGN